MLLHSRAVNALLTLLQGDAGLGSASERAGASAEWPRAVVNPQVSAHVPAELCEDGSISYPVIHVYCERITNQLAEKFSSFSGLVDIVIEIRVSDDSPERIGQVTSREVEAVLRLLHIHRGQWADGVYFGGKYEVHFAPVKRGGTSLLQVSRIKLPVHIRLQ
jgi:hypothetical protein